jgi:hypothetical protein
MDGEVKATILGVVETNTPFLSASDDADRECPVPTFEADFTMDEAKAGFIIDEFGGRGKC